MIFDRRLSAFLVAQKVSGITHRRPNNKPAKALATPRSAVGLYQWPENFSVEVEIIFEVGD